MNDLIAPLPEPLPAASASRLKACTVTLKNYCARIAACAHQALLLELETWPKPGLVSHVDAGSHHDMTSETLCASADSLFDYFSHITEAGALCAPMDELRLLGMNAERTMLAVTRGINTHRGAIFGLGLLCAAAGYRYANDAASGAMHSLGEIVAKCWGPAILQGPLPVSSHGVSAMHRYGAGGARIEAATGFSSVWHIALPALHAVRCGPNTDDEAHRVHVLFALLAQVDDTNLLHRGGHAGAYWARTCARDFLERGSIAHPNWRQDAAAIHRQFVARRLSPGGCADLLAMSLFIDAIETLD